MFGQIAFWQKRLLFRCVQNMQFFDELIDLLGGMLVDLPATSEDCLYLNIYTPANRAHSAKLPVRTFALVCVWRFKYIFIRALEQLGFKENILNLAFTSCPGVSLKKLWCTNKIKDAGTRFNILSEEQFLCSWFQDGNSCMHVSRWMLVFEIKKQSILLYNSIHSGSRLN